MSDFKTSSPAVSVSESPLETVVCPLRSFLGAFQLHLSLLGPAEEDTTHTQRTNKDKHLEKSR